MYVILLVWLAFTIIPTSPFCVHFTPEPWLAKGECLGEPQVKQDERQWQSGTYRGITVGKSTAAELLRKWGKPRETGHWEWDNPKNPKFLLHHYDAQEAAMGAIMVEVETKTGKVAAISASPDELPLSKAIELFGKDYIEARYKECKCDLGYESPIFESPDGNFIYVEYRSRGIAMFVDGEQVTSVQFVDKSIGFTSAKECEKIPECRPNRKSVRRKRI
jgi:hypothetical protein